MVDNAVDRTVRRAVDRTTASRVSADTLSVSLNSLLAEEIRLSKLLLQLISQEKERMDKPLDDENHLLLQSKLSLLQELQSVSTERQDLMLRHGFDSTPQGVEFCALACAHAPGIRQYFSQLSELARACHSANQLLGQMLNRKSGFFSRLLANLSDNGQAPLYQANGLKDAAVVTLHKRLTV